MRNKIFFLLSTLMVSSSFAETISTVNSNTCYKLKDSNKQFILVLKKGEEINAAIAHCADSAKLNGATISGIGALKDPTLNYYNLKTKQYQDKKFHGVYELISLTGNITQNKGAHEPHMHVALSNDRFHVFGGHLGEAVIGVTAEITITPLRGKVIKQVDNDTGLELITTA